MSDPKRAISLYQFYILAIGLLLKTPPRAGAGKATPFGQSLQYEERLIALVILMLLGEELVPDSILRTMPQMEAQVRITTNQSAFIKALAHYYQRLPDGEAIALRAREKMESYLSASRQAEAAGKNPLEGITTILIRRVPPATPLDAATYRSQLQAILTHTRDVVHKQILSHYTIA